MKNHWDGMKAEWTIFKQLMRGDTDYDEERQNGIDNDDMEHFINTNNEGGDESDDPEDMNSSMFPKPSIKRPNSTDGIGTNEEDEELEQIRREQNEKEWMSLCRIAAVSKLARDIIKPHLNYNDGVGAHKPCNERYLPFFKDCIGALDDTHVKARLPQDQ
uniref:Uncharacterized protein n=1 Tax=Solanum lycopersicum TaxID=4081 RepID=A0A3Q7G5Q5_SOLLC